MTPVYFKVYIKKKRNKNIQMKFRACQSDYVEANQIIPITKVDISNYVQYRISIYARDGHRERKKTLK